MQGLDHHLQMTSDSPIDLSSNFKKDQFVHMLKLKTTYLFKLVYFAKLSYSWLVQSSLAKLRLAIILFFFYPHPPTSTHPE